MIQDALDDALVWRPAGVQEEIEHSARTRLPRQSAWKPSKALRPAALAHFLAFMFQTQATFSDEVDLPSSLPSKPSVEMCSATVSPTFAESTPAAGSEAVDMID